MIRRLGCWSRLHGLSKTGNMISAKGEERLEICRD